MSPIVSSCQGLLNTTVSGVHHSSGSEVKLVVTAQKGLAEMILAKPVSGFMQRHGFNVNIRVDIPGEDVVVVNLAERHVELLVIVDIGWSASGRIDKNEREGY